MYIQAASDGLSHIPATLLPRQEPPVKTERALLNLNFRVLQLAMEWTSSRKGPGPARKMVGMESQDCPLTLINYLTNWLTDWLAGWLADWLAGWLTDWLTYWLANWLADWLADWLTGWLADWLTDLLADWLADWLTGWLADWLIGWLTGWLTSWSRDLPDKLRGSQLVKKSPASHGARRLNSPAPAIRP